MLLIKVTARGSFLRKRPCSLKQRKHRLLLGLRTPSQPKTAQVGALAHLVLAESGSDAEMGLDARQGPSLHGWVGPHLGTSPTE